ncbi:MAG: EFR1 family ferrodoxin [Oscillospiraceae bacterium]|nr:EFR1 family ferrodoxin [Oscillospiraceae bacterium]
MVMFYFSGTGNSKYIAELFAKKMNAFCYSIEDKVDFEELINSAATVGFCYPVYGSRPPRNIREFAIEHKNLLNGKRLIIFCTQVLWSGDGARSLTDSLSNISYDVIYAEHFFMPTNVNNFPLIPITGEERNKRYYIKSKAKMEKVCKNIKSGKRVKRGFCTISKWLGLLQGVFVPLIERKYADRVRINREDCNLCGLCVKSCPVNNLSVSGDLIKANGNCMLCYRCTNKCPRHAVSVFLKAKPKKQYWFKC